MATIDQLYTRIILDTNRDDMSSGGELEQAKIDAVTAAIDKHKAEPLWFNRASGSGVTSPANAALPIPSGVFVPAIVAYRGEALARVPLGDIEHRAETGLPTHWAANEETIQLWPIPDAAYTLFVYGTADIDAPAAGEANIWTTQAYDLILAEAKAILCRGPLRDPEGLILAKDAREEALAALRRQSRTRSVSPLKTQLSISDHFNINRG